MLENTCWRRTKSANILYTTRLHNIITGDEDKIYFYLANYGRKNRFDTTSSV